MSDNLDLSTVPAPDVFTPLDTEVIIQRMTTMMTALVPSLGPSLEVETNPITKSFQVFAYEITLWVANANRQSKGLLLAFARGPQLDHLAAFIPLKRLVITPADPSVFPPVPEVLERDDDFRARIRASYDGLSPAGNRGMWLRRAREASGEVKDVNPISPVPTEVTLYVLSQLGNGTASPELLLAVEEHLNPDDGRPHNDILRVESAAINEYAVHATLSVGPGPDAATLKSEVENRVRLFAAAQHRLKGEIDLDILRGQMVIDGVTRVAMTSPAQSIPRSESAAPFMTSLTIEVTNANQQ